MRISCQLKYICKFVDRLREIFDFPVPSNLRGRSFQKTLDCGSSVIVVISLLRSLMEDQVHHLNDTGVTAIAITNNRS